MHDQFNALAMAGAVTTTLRLGTSVTLIGQRDPIWTAKQVASLDHLTDGRVEFGIGFGWNREEQENHGDPVDRPPGDGAREGPGDAGAVDPGRGQSFAR